MSKTASVLLVIVFLCGQFDFQVAKGWATPAVPSSNTREPLHPSALIPQETGTVREVFSGKNSAPVFLIEDAHAVPEAQENIRRLIEYLDLQHSPALIGLEGASGKLDAQFLRSFPDKKTLAQTVKSLAEESEIAGGTQAAILNQRAGHFMGLENWALYEEGIRNYQRALLSSAALLKGIEKNQAKLLRKKKAFYARELFELDTLVDAFYRDQTRLTDLIPKLQNHIHPAAGSELDTVMRILMNQEFETDGESRELTVVLKKVEDFARRTRVTAKALEAFHEKRQAFQTQQIRPGAFALFLQNWCEKQGLAISFSEKWMQIIEDEKKLSRLQGARLIRELETAMASAIERQIEIQAAGDKNIRAELAGINHLHILLRYLRKLAELELTRGEWARIQKTGLFRKLPPVYLAAFSNHLAFYTNAEAREAAMLKTLSEAAETLPAVIVLGGFHTEGIKSKLKSQNRSYWVITPQITAFPSRGIYREQMFGQSAWRDYFEIQNGKISVQDAFSRALRDRLLKSESPLPQSGLIKRWRDQIIRDLADRNKTAKTGDYTRFLDELAQTESPLLKKAEALIRGLKKLETTNQLSENNILKLFGPSTIPPVAAGNAVLSGNTVTAELLLPRSENRANIGLLDPNIYTPEALAWYAKQAKDASDYLAQADNHTQAIRDLLWNQGISYWDVRHAIYPGSHDDAETITSLLKIFPNIRTVTPVSLTVGFEGEQEKQMNYHWENRLRETAARYGVTLSKNLLVRALNRNYFQSDNLSLRATLREITVFVDKYPGHNSSMRSNPSYRTSLLRDAKPGDLLFSLPDRHVPLLEWAEKPLAEKLLLPFLYKFQNWQITRFNGEDFPLRSENRKPEQDIAWIDQLLTRAGINRFSVTKLLYPAALYDAKAVISLLEVFPNIREVIINDLYFKGDPEKPIREEWEKQLAQAAQTAGAKFDTTRLVIKISGGDYLKSPPAAFADEKGRTLILDKNPGSASHLRLNPDFEKSILRDARPGDLAVSLITHTSPMLEWKTPAVAHYVELPYYENAQWSITQLSQADFKRSEQRTKTGAQPESPDAFEQKPSVFQIQGKKSLQEDFFLTERIHVSGVVNGDGWLMAVMDGHGGPAAAMYLKNNLAWEFQTALKENAGDVAAAFESAHALLYQATQSMKSGSTLTAFYIPKGSETGFLYTFGDSPAMLSDSQGLDIIAPEHLANDPAEQDLIRAVAAENGLKEGRNQQFFFTDQESPGQMYAAIRTGEKSFQPLALSRSFGFSPFDPIRPKEAFIAQIDFSENPETADIILASDGIWGKNTARKNKSLRLSQIKERLKSASADSKAQSLAELEPPLAHDNVTVIHWQKPAPPARSENRKQDRHYHKRSDYAYSQDFDRVEELLSRMQKKHGGGKRQILAQLGSWQEKEEAKLKKRHGENGRLGHHHERVYAPLQIIVGHLHNPKFYPNLTDAIIDFFFEIERADPPRFLWLVDILLQDAAFESHSKNPRQRAQGEASDAILRKMLRRADAQNQRVLELMKGHIQSSALKYARAQRTAEHILKNYKPDPIGSIFEQIFSEIDITIIVSRSRSEMRSFAESKIQEIKSLASAFLKYLAKQFRKLAHLEKTFLQAANRIAPDAPVLAPPPATLQNQPEPVIDSKETEAFITGISLARYEELWVGLDSGLRDQMSKGYRYLTHFRTLFMKTSSPEDAKLESSKLIEWSFGWNIPGENVALWRNDNQWNPAMVQPAYLRFFKETASAEFLNQLGRQAEKLAVSSDHLLAQLLTDIRFIELFTAMKLMDSKDDFGFKGALSYRLTQNNPMVDPSPHLAPGRKRTVALDEKFALRLLEGTASPEIKEAQMADLINVVLSHWFAFASSVSATPGLATPSVPVGDNRANTLAAELAAQKTAAVLFRFEKQNQPTSAPTQRSENRRNIQAQNPDQLSLFPEVHPVHHQTSDASSKTLAITHQSAVLPENPVEMEKVLRQLPDVQNALDFLDFKTEEINGKLYIIDRNAETSIFAIPIEFRAYQVLLAAQAARGDAMVILPTGLGKTIVAVLVAGHLLKKNPDRKILFTAPSNVLVEQHAELFGDEEEHLRDAVHFFKPGWAHEILSKHPHEKRDEIWKNSKIIIAVNDLVKADSTRLPLNEVGYLIIDEAHQIGATDENHYAGTEIVRNYHSQNPNGTILGLTASPPLRENVAGWEKTLQLAEEKIFAASDRDAWVFPYVKDRVTGEVAASWDERTELLLAKIDYLEALSQESGASDLNISWDRLRAQIKFAFKYQDAQTAFKSIQKIFEDLGRIFKSSAHFEAIKARHSPGLSLMRRARSDLLPEIMGLSPEKAPRYFTVSEWMRDLIKVESQNPHYLKFHSAVMRAFAGLIATQIHQTLLWLETEAKRMVILNFRNRTENKDALIDLNFNIESGPYTSGQVDRAFKKLPENFRLLPRTKAARADVYIQARQKNADRELSRLTWLSHLEQLQYWRRVMDQDGPEYLFERLKKALHKKGRVSSLMNAQLNHTSLYVFLLWLVENKMRHPKTDKTLALLKKIHAGSTKHKTAILTENKQVARDLANLIAKELGLKTAVLVGQSDTTNGDGMTIKEQADIVHRFNAGEIDVLVGTSVMRQGLDIQGLDTAIAYSPHKTAIEKIQWEGRIARLIEGRAVTLFTRYAGKSPASSEEIHIYKTRRQTEKTRGLIDELQGKVPYWKFARSESRAVETLAKDAVAALNLNQRSAALAREMKALIPAQTSADTFGVYLRSEARKIAASSAVRLTAEPKVTRLQAEIFIDSVLKHLQQVTDQEKPAVGFADSADASFIEALEKTKSLLGLAVLSKQTAATLTRQHLRGLAFKIVSGFENYKTETALPLISRRFSAALTLGSGLFGLEISDGGIEDEPFLETAEKVLQITAGVLLAAKIKNPEDLSNPVKMAGFIQDLNRELFGAGAPDIFKWEGRRLQIQRSVLIGIIQAMTATRLSSVSA